MIPIRADHIACNRLLMCDELRIVETIWVGPTVENRLVHWNSRRNRLKTAPDSLLDQRWKLQKLRECNHVACVAMFKFSPYIHEFSHDSRIFWCILFDRGTTMLCIRTRGYSAVQEGLENPSSPISLTLAHIKTIT